jgi:hypothetical protein
MLYVSNKWGNVKTYENTRTVHKLVPLLENQPS